jgi:predicted RNA binding protein YcfA (HicA-like mRNA interferase family)
LAAGFQLVRSKGNHRIFARANERTVIPFHRGKMLHPRLVREVLLATGEM